MVLKHDQFVLDLCDRIRPDYDEIFTNVEFLSERHRKIAEADVIAVREDGVHIYEVKCRYRIMKARKQLRKMQQLLPNVRGLYFYCGESKALVTVP